jgi:peptide/nickel transport system substrate-binding protein
MSQNKIISVALLFIVGMLSACQVLKLAEPIATPLPPTPTPIPSTELTICMRSEPDSLYLYGLDSQLARDILSLIAEGPRTQTDGTPDPAILQSIPNFSDGSAVLTPVSVRAGDQVVNAYGQLIALQAGARVFPSGCTTAACAVTWDGTSDLQMDQASTTFQLKTGITWSDGQPLTAAESVFSFNLAFDTDTPVEKTLVNKTASYRAIDESSVQWVGKPGLLPVDFSVYFWLPLPQHAWGDASAADLLNSQQAKESPLGWGPYTLDEWARGDHLRLKKNQLYFRAGEGLPKYDYVTFKFVQSADLNQELSGACDVIADDAIDTQWLAANVANLETSGYQLRKVDSGNVEFLAFGINPVSYDDSYYPYGSDRPDIFGDVNTRKAIALCIDRQGILDELTGGLAKAADTYLAKENSLLNGLALSQYAYDPAQGKALLDQLGWKDYDQNPATPLTMIATNTTVPYGTNFAFTLLTSQSEMRKAIADKIAANLAECGIQVTVEQKPLTELYQPGPDGAVFGRNFDMVLLSMNFGSEPHCGLFTSSEIPTNANYWLGTSTGGSNFMGYRNTAYDQSCDAAESAGLDMAVYTTNIQSTLQILADTLPIIPLYNHPEYLLVRGNLCLADNLDSLQKMLFSIESIDPNVSCGS